MKKRRWSKQEHLQLLTLCERRTYDQIAARLGRTPCAVKTYMCENHLKPYCAMHSLTEASRMTGYAVPQLERARNALGQRWRKIPYSWTKRYCITPEQLEALCEYLKTEPDAPFEERFWSYVQKQVDGHWRWLGTFDAFSVQRRGVTLQYRPQRMAWLLTRAPLESYQHVFRDCAQPGCINPDHCRILERCQLEAG